MAPVHTLSIRVYYEDTDFTGVVYHASYLRFMERGRTDLLREAGIGQGDLHGAHAFHFVVRRMTIDWLKPARMDDIVTVETRAGELRGASMTMRQRVLRGDETLVTAEVLVAGVVDGRPARLPPAIRAALSGGPDA
ncbi:tol-pal system-associated acyl-CoA thioesterase [Alsobacter sp. SYSU M60028]|uniref:Tol-pal system-associated acyl-CoA thioesterase n=1 Tax=Alsobacter ponti TaxID=2962936 RepID=A0ABT1LE84_9HYPH|nr:tol-pal system-associated acyl-CoA thioesterase [Alsobacter ponti]